MTMCTARLQGDAGGDVRIEVGNIFDVWSTQKGTDADNGLVQATAVAIVIVMANAICRHMRCSACALQMTEIIQPAEKSRAPFGGYRCVNSPGVTTDAQFVG